jgi:hypothetical protein
MGDLNATVTASSLATSNNKNCSLETASQEKKLLHCTFIKYIKNEI